MFYVEKKGGNLKIKVILFILSQQSYYIPHPKETTFFLETFLFYQCSNTYANRF